jgi:hypothetical protein
MKLSNNTPTAAYYGIHGGGSSNCGNIPAHGSVDLPWYDNKQNVTVGLHAVVPNTPPGEIGPFSITIPKSGKGMTVTFGLFQE